MKPVRLLVMLVVASGLALSALAIGTRGVSSPAAASCNNTALADEAIEAILKGNLEAARGLASYRVISTVTVIDQVIPTLRWTRSTDYTFDLVTKLVVGTYRDYDGREFEYYDSGDGVPHLREPGGKPWLTWEQTFPQQSAGGKNSRKQGPPWECTLSSGVLIGDSDNQTAHLRFIHKAKDASVTDMTADIYVDRETMFTQRRTNRWQEHVKADRRSYSYDYIQECQFLELMLRQQANY